MELVQTVVIAIATLGILVAFHEYGHFWVARKCGVKVLRFAIGFGPALARWKGRDDTEYAICAIPLGGYVKMLDERDGDVPASLRPQAFNAQSVWARIAIVSAGPLANFLLAVLVFWLLFFRGESGLVPIVESVEPGTPAYFAGLESGQEIVSVDGGLTPTVSALSLRLLDRLGDTGTIRLAAKYPGSDVVYESETELERWLAGASQPDPIAGLGVTLRRPVIPPQVDTVVEGSPAQQAGFEPGDVVVSADGEAMPSWQVWVEYVRARPEQPIDVALERNGVVTSISVTPERKLAEDGTGYGSVGMSVRIPEIPEDMIRVFDRGLVESLGASLNRTAELIGFTFESLWKMVKGLISTDNLSGPITIAQVAASSAEGGLFSWLGFLALLSISLGALNLLPVPVLDGGHLLYFVIEALTGRAVPEKAQMWGYQVGLVLVLSVMMFALYNDFSRL